MGVTGGGAAAGQVSLLVTASLAGRGRAGAPGPPQIPASGTATVADPREGAASVASAASAASVTSDVNDGMALVLDTTSGAATVTDP